MEEFEMKKSVIFIILTAVLLFSSCSPSTGSEKKLIGEIDFGSTKNHVIEQMGYSDEYYNDEDYDDAIIYEDIKMFGQYCRKVKFGFDYNELDSIMFDYPSAADPEIILKELKKAYGESSDSLSLESHQSFIWYHNNATISFMMGEDIPPSILFLKNDD